MNCFGLTKLLNGLGGTERYGWAVSMSWNFLPAGPLFVNVCTAKCEYLLVKVTFFERLVIFFYCW